MRRTITALLLATALVAGCGGDDDEESAATPEATQEPAAGGGGGETVEVSSPEDGSLKFDQTELTTPAGEVTFSYSNPSQVPHAFEVEGVEGATDTITEGEASVTVKLDAGEYVFYCPVGQHRQAGMEGTLTVE
jgi:plastocyanin